MNHVHCDRCGLIIDNHTVKCGMRFCADCARILFECGERAPWAFHDVTDPHADAEARKLSFTREQANYLDHHIRNAVQLLMVPSGPNLVKVTKRLLGVCDAARERIV